MGYRRLFIIRKDLNMSPGKLSSQVSHCAEAYWTSIFRKCAYKDIISVTHENGKENIKYGYIVRDYVIDTDVFEQYIKGSFVKTICEARNKNHLLKAKTIAEEMGLIENEDFGLIRDNCLTELIPEDEDGRTLTGIWFKPLPDDIAHKISKKYQLYK